MRLTNCCRVVEGYQRTSGRVTTKFCQLEQQRAVIEDTPQCDLLTESLGESSANQKLSSGAASSFNNRTEGITVAISRLRSKPVNERNGLWVLKKS